MFRCCFGKRRRFSSTEQTIICDNQYISEENNTNDDILYSIYSDKGGSQYDNISDIKEIEYNDVDADYNSEEELSSSIDSINRELPYYSEVNRRKTSSFIIDDSYISSISRLTFSSKLKLLNLINIYYVNNDNIIQITLDTGNYLFHDINEEFNPEHISNYVKTNKVTAKKIIDYLNSLDNKTIRLRLINFLLSAK